MIQATDGNLYGVASSGGTNLAGMVFKLTPSGAFSILYSFCAQTNCTDGSNPVGVIEGSDGSFYGTTASAGTQNPACFSNGCGTVFRLTRNGVLTTLHTFSGADGFLRTGLAQATNGAFYGVTTGTGNGTVFTLSTGLHPFVELLPGSGKAGSTVQILGRNLSDATAVSFNGTVAPFMVVSKNLISATVPSGATSGFVTVTTPGGTLKSNTRFVVRRQRGAVRTLRRPTRRTGTTVTHLSSGRLGSLGALFHRQSDSDAQGEDCRHAFPWH